ncbi:DoxX family protein [Planctomicrobium sp. SH661]|uniref:DoxX family protein n=1 Tax=Planctomicrobium sp. SH661 TaxID=3448124 RepID=UPI003F5C6990
MKDLRRVSGVAILLIVLLRMSIGWQFLYEGLWKRATLSTPNPWTSEGYLKNAQGPLRNYFRDMTGDPDDLKWLDYSEMSRRWYAWRDRFAKHYKLDEKQLQELNRKLDGSEEEDTAPDALPPTRKLSQKLAELPQSVTDPKKLEPAFKYDGEAKVLTAVLPVLPSEEAAALSLVDVERKPDGTFVKKSDPEQKADQTEANFYAAVVKLASDSRQLSFRHQLAGALRGNPENAGVSGATNDKGSIDIVMGTTLPEDAGEKKHVVRYGKIQEYKDLVEDYNRAIDKAAMDYQYDHAAMLGKKLAIMRSELVGPIKSLENSLKDAAIKLLTPEQLKSGAAPAEETPLAKSDRQVMWGLIILGSLLIIGFFTRLAALGGAVLLMMFYLVMPPWPGVPPVPGPEHSFIVNKNLIECIALLAIAALPTGTWFGLDALFYTLFRRSKKHPAKA